MNNTKKHQDLVHEILATVGSMPEVRLWKAVNGVFRDLNSDRVIKVGLPGAADLTGIIMCVGRLEIEVKTGSGSLSKEQRSFKKMIEEFGGYYIEAHSLEDAVHGVKKALQKA